MGGSPEDPSSPVSVVLPEDSWSPVSGALPEEDSAFEPEDVVFSIPVELPVLEPEWSSNAESISLSSRVESPEPSPESSVPVVLVEPVSSWGGMETSQATNRSMGADHSRARSIGDRISFHSREGVSLMKLAPYRRDTVASHVGSSCREKGENAVE